MSTALGIIIIAYSFVPALALAWYFNWLDRHERQPLQWVLLTFFWGAFGAGVFSSLLNSFFLQRLGNSGIDLSETTLVSNVLIAPLIEEITKAIFLIWLFVRKRITNATDGLLYGIVIGLGFAAAENVNYARHVFVASGELAMWNNLWMREVATTLLHAASAGVFGAMLGYSRSIKGQLRVFFFVNGLVLACAVHAYWNFLARATGVVGVESHLMDGVIVAYLCVLATLVLVTFFWLVRLESGSNGFVIYVSKGLGVLAGFMAAFYLAYQLIVVSHVQDSDEYRAAMQFVRNSPSLQEQLVGKLRSVEYDNIRVNEKGDYGICEILFRLQLPNDLNETLRIGLVKVADFWFVYQAVLNPGQPARIEIESTYQKILLFQQQIDLKDIEAAHFFLDEIAQENTNPVLNGYLSAQVLTDEGRFDDADRAIALVMPEAKYSQPAILYQKGMVAFGRKDYPAAIQIFHQLIENISRSKETGSPFAGAGIFANLPKDPFLASVNPRTILASAQKTLALSYTYSRDYTQGLMWSERAVAQADLIHSSVTRLNALYVKALNLFYLKRYDDAEQAFKAVAVDIDNANLSQRAMAYYYRAYIAAQAARHDDSLDFYETAVSLDPANAVIRRDAITYLTNRNFVGDLEIALGMAIRGMDYESDRDGFKATASGIFKRMGLPDKTLTMP